MPLTSEPIEAPPTTALAGTQLFVGVDAHEVDAMLACLGARRRAFDAGEFVMREGDPVHAIGLVLAGIVRMERTDVWGGRSILGQASFGETFAEAYACAPGSVMGVDVVTAAPSVLLFLDVERVLTTCPSACTFHTRMLRNLLGAIAVKNLQLSRKISDITPRTIRQRLLSYLSAQARAAGSRHFSVPFNRQQLADYLCVDRSALSHELAKMRAEGVIDFDRGSFFLPDASAPAR